jgi:arginine decarboxylase
VKVSSILPAGCQRITPEQGMKLITPGQITFAVLAESQTNEPGQIITAGLGIAQPKDPSLHGYITELEAIIGRTAEDVEEDVVEMAIENLGSEWNPKFEGEKVYRKGKKNYKIEGKDVSVDSIVMSAEGAEKNQYTIVVTAAIFIYEHYPL